jgi:hypothetical protein
MITTSSANALAGTESLLRSAASILLDAQSIAKDDEQAEIERQINTLALAVLDLAKNVGLRRME